MATGKFRYLQEVNKVHLLIEKYLVKYISQQEVAEIIFEKAKIIPAFTETVWKKLEEDNPDFFKAYHVRRMVKQQIDVFNKLLLQQMDFLMQQPQATGASLNSDSNGSYIPQLKQGSASYAPEHTSQEYMHASIVSCPPLQNMNHTGATMSAHGGRIAAAPNMFGTQSLDNDFSQGMNGGITKQGPDDAVNMHQETWDGTLNDDIAQLWEPIDIDLFSKPNPLDFSQSAANICHGSMQQGWASYAPGHTSQEYMHASIVSRSPLQNMNNRDAAVSAHVGRIEDTQTMFHPQSLDNCFLKGMNGEIIKQGQANDVNTHEETREGTLNGADDISQHWNYLDVNLFSKQITGDFSQFAANICHGSGPSF